MATKVWAHRGASAYYPENTMKAFRAAHEAGAHGIELDVQLSADGVVVVTHDETIDRVSTRNGYVQSFTLAELKEFNFNLPHPETGDEPIATLEEVLQWIAPLNMTLNIELKTNVIIYEGIEQKTLELVERYGMMDRAIFSSFNHYSLKTIQQLNPQAKTAILYMSGIYNVHEYAANLAVQAVHPPLPILQVPNFVKDCHDQGLNVHVWTVDDPKSIRQCADLGIDAVITNDPALALSVL